MAEKKLLYIVRYPIYEDFNLRGKFDGQLAAFRNLGMDVYHLVFDKEYFYLIHNGEQKRICRATTKLPLYFHTKVYYDMHRAVMKAADLVRFDYVYWRGAPSWLLVMRKKLPWDAGAGGICRRILINSALSQKPWMVWVLSNKQKGEATASPFYFCTINSLLAKILSISLLPKRNIL